MLSKGPPALLASLLPLFLGLGAGAPPPALAQAPETRPEPPWPPPPPPTTIPSTAPPEFTRPEGPGLRPAATIELHPSVRLSEEYSDNFNQSARDEQDNLRTILSPGLLALINAAMVKGQVGYTLSGVHDSSTGDTNLFHSLLGHVGWGATPRLRLSASDVLTRSDEPARADQLNLRQGRRTFTSNAFGLTADYLVANIGTQGSYRLTTFFDEEGADTVSHAFGVGASTTFYRTNTASLGYEYLTSETSGPRDPRALGGAGDSDTTRHQFTASLTRELTSTFSAGVTGSYALYTQTGGALAGETDSTLWNISLFTAYALPGRLSLNGTTGVGRLESDSGESSVLFTTATTLTYWFARATATVGVDQGFSPTFAAGENFGIVKTRGFRGSLSYPFTPFISGSGSAFFRTNEFTGVGGGEADRSEDTWGGAISFSVRLLRWLSLGLEYAYTEASSSESFRSFSENRARASLSAAW